MILISLLVLLIYGVGCLCAGALVLRVAAGRRGLGASISSPASATTAFLLGSGILTNTWLLVGLSPGGWLNRWTVVGVLIAVYATGGWFVWPSLSAAVRQVGRAVRRMVITEPWAWKVIGLACLVLVGLYGLASALPPKGDAAAFYMALPKLVAHAHRLVLMPFYERFMTVGLHGEMHFAALILLGGAPAATMFVFVIWLAMIGMLLEIARTAGLKARGRWIALAMIVTSSAVMRLTCGGKVDLFGAAMGLAAVYWALEAAGPRNLLALSLAGVFAGLAVVAKLSLLGTLVPMVGLLALWRTTTEYYGTGRLGRHTALCVAMLVVCGAVAAVPHVLKNAVLCNAPLAPLYVSEGTSWLLQEWLTPDQVKHLLSLYPLAPFLGRFNGMYGAMSALIPAFLPLCLLSPRMPMGQWIRRPLPALTVVSALAVAAWAVFESSVFTLRYFLPPLILLALPAARGAELVFEPGRKRCLQVGVIVCLVMALAATFNRPQAHLKDAAQYAFGLVDEAQAGDYPGRLAAAINDRAKAGERVFAGTFYTYFLRPDLLASLDGLEDASRWRDIADPQLRWRRFYEEGFRYVMIDSPCGALSPDGKSFRLRRLVELNSDDLPPDLFAEPVYIDPTKHGAPPIHGVFRIERKSVPRSKHDDTMKQEN